MVIVKTNFQSLIAFVEKHATWVNAITLITVIALSIIFQIFEVPSVKLDSAYQSAAAHQFLNGNQFTYPVSNNAADLAEITYVPVLQWPHGFPIIAAPILYFTQDIILTDFILRCLSVIVFFMSMFVILNTFRQHLSTLTRTSLMFFWVLVQPQIFTTTDLMALAITYATFAVWVLTHKSHASYGWMVIIGLMVGLAAVVRYVFTIYIVVIPAMLLLMAWIYKERHYVWYSLTVGVSAALVASVQYIYNLQNTGNVVRTDLVDGGFYWDNLLLALPLGSSATGVSKSLDFLSDRLPMEWTFLLLEWTISFAVIAIVIWVSFKGLWAWSQTPTDKKHHDHNISAFILFGLFLFLITIAVLMGLSIINAPRFYDGSFYTFISLKRYYAVVSIWVVVMLALYIEDFAKSRTQLHQPTRYALHTVIGVPLLLCILFAMVLWSVSMRHYLTTFEPQITEQQYSENKPMAGYVWSVESGDTPFIVIAGSIFDQYKANYLSVMNGNRYYNGSIDETTYFDSSEPLVALVIIPLDVSPTHPERQALERLVTERDGQLIDEVAGYATFYHVEFP